MQERKRTFAERLRTLDTAMSVLIALVGLGIMIESPTLVGKLTGLGYLAIAAVLVHSQPTGSYPRPKN